MPNDTSRFPQSHHPANPPVCRSASPTAMAQVIATLSERKPACIGMRSRTSAAAWTCVRYARQFAAEQQDVARRVAVVEVGRRRARGEQREAQPRAFRHASNASHDACRTSFTASR